MNLDNVVSRSIYITTICVIGEIGSDLLTSFFSRLDELVCFFHIDSHQINKNSITVD